MGEAQFKPEGQLIFDNKAFAAHFGGLFKTHQVEHGGYDVAQTALFQLYIRAADDEGHGIEGVGGVGRAVGLLHLFRVAVVGGDDSGAAQLFGGGYYLAHAGVNGAYGAYYRVEYASVANHVAVCEVDDDHVVKSAADALASRG